MSGYGVQGCDVGKAKLTQGVLKNGDAGRRVGGCGCRRIGVDSFNDLVDLRGDKGV